MKKYVRVSDILAQFSDFSKINPAVLDAKAKVGTNVHEAIGDMVSGNFPLLETEKAVGYFRSYERWHSANKPQYLRMEQRFFDDKLMITGQIDAVINVGDKQHMLIDFKTSYTANPKVWELQAHFYWHLCHVNSVELNPTMTWINLDRKGGNPKLFTFEVSETKIMECIELANKWWLDYENNKDHE